MTYADTKFQQKLAYLQRLLKLRLNFMKYATDVEIAQVDDMIQVTWSTKRGNRFFDTEIIEFPVGHLGKRIEHYKRKLRHEFKTRHECNYLLKG